MSSSFPPRERFSDSDRQKIAAVLVVRAVQSKTLVFPQPKHFGILRLLHNHLYNNLLRGLCLCHTIFLTMFEAPPKLEGSSEEEIVAEGYYGNYALVVDGVVILIYTIHLAMLLIAVPSFHRTAKGKFRVDDTTGFFLSITIFLLFLDFVVNAGIRAARPLRILRPFIYIFNSDRSLFFAQSCLETFAPLAKTCLILLSGIIFFSVIGLNLFSGNYSEENVFGAACLDLAQEPHPFQNFGWSFVSLYISGTADNHPNLVWPFYTCNCKYYDFANKTETALLITDNCNMRKWTTTTFFVAFMTTVFFCLGNIVLAVCYHFFDQISQKHLINRSVKLRAGLLASFHYLHTSNGGVSYDDFIGCISYLAHMQGSRHVKQAEFIFNEIDVDNNRTLSLTEWFMIPDLLDLELIFHEKNDSLSVYSFWKTLALRRWIRAVVKEPFPGNRLKRLPIIDVAVLLLVIVNTALASVSTSQGDGGSSFNVVVTFVLVGEFVLKVAGLGWSTFIQERWNQFDVVVMVLSLMAFGTKMLLSTTNYDNVIGILPSIRCFRILKVLTAWEGQSEADTYYRRLLTSLATTVPLCFQALVVVFFYTFAFAFLGMLTLGQKSVNSRNLPLGVGFVQYTMDDDRFEDDWADMHSAMLTVVAILVGNTWSNFMLNAMATAGFNYAFFFIAFHAIGVFLVLNIIQSLFVFAFSTLLDTNGLQDTWEWHVRLYIVGLVEKSSKPVKFARRVVKLEYLMITPESVEQAYEDWLEKQMKDDKNDFLKHELMNPYSPKTTRRSTSPFLRAHRVLDVPAMQRATTTSEDPTTTAEPTPRVVAEQQRDSHNRRRHHRHSHDGRKHSGEEKKRSDSNGHKDKKRHRHSSSRQNSGDESRGRQHSGDEGTRQHRRRHNNKSKNRKRSSESPSVTPMVTPMVTPLPTPLPTLQPSP